MAKSDDEKPSPPAKKPAGPRYQVRVKAGAGFDRIHTPYRLRFLDGLATTDEQAAADHCAELCGYEVTDTHTGKVRNPIE